MLIAVLDACANSYCLARSTHQLFRLVLSPLNLFGVAILQASKVRLPALETSVESTLVQGVGLKIGIVVVAGILKFGVLI